MDRNYFLEAIKLLNANLIHQVMDRTYNSVGSNVFFEFGERKEFVSPNGRKFFQKEWCIWLSWTSWRITQYNKYIIGSDENPEVNIQNVLNDLLGKRILVFQFISQFLDVQIEFEGGYQVTTFFNKIDENQWALFLPPNEWVTIDCSSEKAIQDVQQLSERVGIENKYKILDFSFSNAIVTEFSLGEYIISTITCSEGFSIYVGSSGWRLIENNQYQIGRSDYYFSCLESQSTELGEKLVHLIGKKIKHISIDSSNMDARLEFEGGCSLELFAQVKTDQWKIFRNGEVIFCANMQ